MIAKFTEIGIASSRSRTWHAVSREVFINPARVSAVRAGDRGAEVWLAGFDEILLLAETAVDVARDLNIAMGSQP